MLYYLWSQASCLPLIQHVFMLSKAHKVAERQLEGSKCFLEVLLQLHISIL